ncbi:YrhC family protein [Anoxybacillus sp. J5B_2022]|uniref:YrhC family protein n=1 Tax=Anoxybacillus sp. J5B_2022 TaxID=3003246 RepID=UPI002286C9C6|nr:YrhC family protein [Anoxybacillus sp. J5B_2022]MCZ0756032.1 YrhC family protein [Anoxybacillus sp. J5B_2022]
MNERKIKEWRAKASDYKVYSLVLFAVSTFLYLGTIIPHALTAEKKPLVLLAIGVLLGSAIYFARKATVYAQKAEEENSL